MIESARSTDWTPLSRESGSPSGLDFGSMVLRRVTSLFIATCIHPWLRVLVDHSPSPRLRGESSKHRQMEMPLRLNSEAAFVVDNLRAGPRRAPTCTWRRAPRPEVRSNRHRP